MLESKIDDLIKCSLDAFSNKNNDSLISIRKCGEAFCRVLIYNHYELQKSAKIDNYCSKQPNRITKKKFFYLSGFIKEIANKNSGIINNIAHREFVERHLRILAFYGNAVAHVYDKQIDLNYDDVKISQLIVQRLLYWLFIDHLQHKIPSQLIKYIAKYDIFVDFNTTINKEWANTLIQNLQIQNYTLFSPKLELCGGENYKQRSKQAINTAKTAILIYTIDKSDQKWFKEQYNWIKNKKRGYSQFHIIPLTVDSDKNQKKREDIHIVDFSEAKKYKQSFITLIKAIEQKPPNSYVHIDRDKIKLPLTQAKVVHQHIYIKKSYLFIFIILFALYSAILVYVKPTIQTPQDSSIQQPLDDLQFPINEKNKKD